MKKILICLAIIIGVFVNQPVFAVSWYHVGEVGGYAVYVDNSSVQKDSRYAYLWVKWGHLRLHVMFDKYERAYVVGDWYEGDKRYYGQSKVFPVSGRDFSEVVYDSIW